MKATGIFLAFLWSIPLLAQAPTVITMDDEPHHHLVFKNDVLKMFLLDLEPRDSFLMHRHDYDDVSIVIGDATTVSTTPGQADVLTISKTGDVRLAGECIRCATSVRPRIAPFRSIWCARKPVRAIFAGSKSPTVRRIARALRPQM